MRTIMKLMAVCMSCILLGMGSVNVHAAEKSLHAEEILEKRPYGSYENAYADSRYGYVSYRWKGSGLCIRETVKGGKMQKKEIPLRGKAKKYAKKRERYSPCEWMDVKGNFYFLTSEGRKKKCVRFLNKVNKQGKLVKRIKLNDWLKIENYSDPKFFEDDGTKNYYDLYIEQVTERDVIANYYGSEIGYVIFDRDTGKVKRQIIIRKNPGRYTGIWEFYHKQMLFTVSKDGRLFYEKVTAGKKITLPSGNKIRYQKVKKRKQIEIGQLPEEAEVGPTERMFASWKNHVYLLAPEGYYRINTKDLSIERLASTSELSFWKWESDVKFITFVVLSEKKCIFSLYYYPDDVPIEEHAQIPIWQGTIS